MAQTVLWAKDAARQGDLQAALAWLDVLEVVDRALEPEIQQLRGQWRASVNTRHAA